MNKVRAAKGPIVRLSSHLGVTASTNAVTKEAAIIARKDKGKANSLLSMRQDNRQTTKQPRLPSSVFPLIKGVLPNFNPHKTAHASPKINMTTAKTPKGSGKKEARAQPHKN